MYIMLQQMRQLVSLVRVFYYLNSLHFLLVFLQLPHLSLPHLSLPHLNNPT